jgi:Zincin-like metallopeptidase
MHALAGRPRSPKTVAMADPTFADPLAWRAVKAPSLEELEVLAETAFRRLPQKFRALCEGLVIRVDDFPTEEVLDELEAQSEFDLLGLFQGVGLPFRSESASGRSSTTGPSTTSRSAPSSPTCWCTRSATISASPTTTWRRSRRRWIEPRAARVPDAVQREAVHR